MADVDHLSPTISLAETAQRAWDVVVVGAGPAGAITARQLARRQAAVLLVDRAQFPRGKVCGCYLNGSALATLSDVGLGALTMQLGAPAITAVCLGTDSRVARLSLPAGAALSRESLDTALVAAAISSGAHFLPGAEARLSTATLDFRQLQLDSGNGRVTVGCRVVVAADGVGGQLLRDCQELAFRTARASLVGVAAVTDRVPDGYQPGTIHMALGSAGYVGCLQLEDGRLDIAAALAPEKLRSARNPGELAAEISQQSGLPELAGLRQLRWRGTPPLSRIPTTRGGHRLFLVGDAAGFVEPFTGEGIFWALASGRAVTPLVLQAVEDYSPALIRHWNNRHELLLGRRHRLCSWLTRILRHRQLAAAGVAAIARWPGLARPLVRWLNQAP